MKKINCMRLLLFIVLTINTLTVLKAEFPITNYHYYRTANGLSPAVSATGGINLTNARFPNTSYYNPAVLAFRRTSTLSTSLRFYNEKETLLNELGIPENESFQWHSESMAYIGIEAENVAFNYFSMANIEHEYTDHDDFQNYLDYYLDCYRVSYGSKSGMLAFGLNISYLTGRTVYLRETKENNITKVDNFVDEKARGYSLDFGAVVKSNNFSYGLYIPNLMSKLYWSESDNVSLQRRFAAGVQVGNDRSFISSGISRRFRFRSANTYHFGFQQFVQMGTIRGQSYIMPVRLGAYSSESFWKFKDLNYGFGTGIQSGYFHFDISLNTSDFEWDNYYIMTSISMTM